MPPKKTTAKLPPKKSSTDNKNNNNNNSNNNKSSTTDEPEKQQQSNPPPTGRPPYDPYKHSFVKQDYDQTKNKQDRNNNNNNNDQDDFTQQNQQISEIEDLLHIPDPQPFLVSCVVNHIHNLRVMVDPRDSKQKKRDEKRQKRRNGAEKQEQKQKQKSQRNTGGSDAATIATTSMKNQSSTSKFSGTTTMMTASTSSGSVPSFISNTAKKRISHRSVSDDDDDDDTSSDSTENDNDDDTTSSSNESTDSDSSSCSNDDDGQQQKLVSSSSAIATATSSSGSNTNYSYNKLINTNNNNNNDNNHNDDNDEIGYNNNPHLWDYFSLWDCPPTVVSSLRKRNLYYFQQEQIRKDKERKKLKIENDLLKLELLPTNNDGKKSSNQKDKEKSSKKEKKEKKSSKKEKKSKDKKSKRTSDYVDDDEVEEKSTVKNTHNNNDNGDDDDETGGLPACYLSKYDKRENPILVATSNDKEASTLAYQATTIDDDFYYPRHQHHDEDDQKQKKHIQNQADEAPPQRKDAAGGDNDDSSYFFSSPIIDAPPSRVVFDPLRYHKIVAKTEFETPHPAFPQMSPMFNGKMEISCVLTAPTMYHDMPSKAEAKAIREREQQYFAGIPSTEKMIRENMATSSIPNFPSAAALRSYGRGAVRELEKILQEKKQKTKINNKNHHSGQHDDNDNDDIVDADLAAYLKLKEQRRRRETSKATGKRHFAGLLKLQFSTSASSSFTLVHCLGPVQFLPPIESAIFVPQTPTSISLCIAEVPDPELHPMEQILLKYVIEILETDEYSGSLSSAHVNNLVRETPQFQFVIGGGAGGSISSSSSSTNNATSTGVRSTTTNGPFYETWIDFITAHSNIEFAIFTYTDSDLKEMMQLKEAEARATSGLIIPNEPRLVAWKNVHHFMEGDYSRWANKLENERQVVEVMKSCLGVRPYEQKELVKLLGSNRAFVSLTAPCLKKMLSIVSEDSRYVILNSRYHPLTIEMRKELILASANDDNSGTNYSSLPQGDDGKKKKKQAKQQQEQKSSTSSFHPREIKMFDQDRLRMAGFSSLVSQNQQTTKKL